MVNKILLLSVLALVLIVPFALATTEINVKTLPEHKVSIFVLEPAEVYTLLESYHVVSDSSGIVTVSYSENINKVNIKVKVTKDGQEVLLHDFEDMDTGGSLYLQVIPGSVLENYREVEEKEAQDAAAQAEAAAAEAAILENQAEQTDEAPAGGDAGVTGFAVSDVVPKFSNMTYFIVGGIILALVVVVFVLKSGALSSIVKKDPAFDYKKVNPERGEMDKELENAERRIREAETEIAKLRNKDKIALAEKKLEADRADLDKLRSGLE